MSLLLLFRPSEGAAPDADPSPLTFTYRDRGHTFTVREGAMQGFRLAYHRNAERPSVEGWLLDDDGTLLDLSGYTFSLKIGGKGSTAVLTKTSNITGAAGSGVEPTGTPNVTITWTAGELNITPGRYSAQLVATTSGLDRVFEGTFHVIDSIN